MHIRYKVLRLRMSGALTLPALGAFILFCYNFSFTSYRFSEHITSGSICAMAQVISHEPVSRGAWVRSQVVCAVCGGPSGSGAGFSSRTLAFPCHHYTIAPCSSIHVSPKLYNLSTWQCWQITHLKTHSIYKCFKIGSVN